MKEPKRTVLWSATGQQANNTSIELTDSIDNYDELWFYGSGTRTYTPCVITEYPVIPGEVNLGGPFYCGQWATGDTFLLCNGTQMFLSGNSGYVASSFYFGKNNGATAWAAALVNNRANDIRPFKIVGLKYKTDPNRATLWESTGVNLYNQNISLSEPLTHFDRFEVYSSGYETGANGCRHAGKNIYQTQPRIMNCGSWAYTPWKYAERHNLLIGEEMLISGNSGHIRSGYYWGMGNQTTAYAAGRWNDNYALSALQPYKIVGVDHKPVLNLNLINGEHGTVSADTTTGCEYDYVNLEATPDEGWYFSGYSISGAQMTGNQFRFNNSDVTVEGLYTDEGYPITYETTVGGSCTGDTNIYIPGGTGITLQTAYNTYYRLSGYEVTGGTINGNVLTPTGPCTARAVYKVNYFTATGNFEKGSNVTCDAGTTYASTTVYSNVGEKYALHVGHTGDISTSWYSTSNRWKPNGASAYSITLNAKMTFTGKRAGSYSDGVALMTGVTMVGSTQNQSQTFSVNVTAATTKNYSKTVTTTTQNVNYGVSARLGSQKVAAGGSTRRGIATYIATGTTGTWTATGIAP